MPRRVSCARRAHTTVGQLSMKAPGCKASHPLAYSLALKTNTRRSHRDLRYCCPQPDATPIHYLHQVIVHQHLANIVNIFYLSSRLRFQMFLSEEFVRIIGCLALPRTFWVSSGIELLMYAFNSSMLTLPSLSTSALPSIPLIRQ